MNNAYDISEQNWIDLKNLGFTGYGLLPAADWLAHQHQIGIRFTHNCTTVYLGDGKPTEYPYTFADHRNAAMKHAILIVKERKK